MMTDVCRSLLNHPGLWSEPGSRGKHITVKGHEEHELRGRQLTTPTRVRHQSRDFSQSAWLSRHLSARARIESIYRTSMSKLSLRRWNFHAADRPVEAPFAAEFSLQTGSK